MIQRFSQGDFLFDTNKLKIVPVTSFNNLYLVSFSKSSSILLVI
jgi:hypothetical protein